MSWQWCVGAAGGDRTTAPPSARGHIYYLLIAIQTARWQLLISAKVLEIGIFKWKCQAAARANFNSLTYASVTGALIKDEGLLLSLSRFFRSEFVPSRRRNCKWFSLSAKTRSWGGLEQNGGNVTALILGWQSPFVFFYLIYSLCISAVMLYVILTTRLTVCSSILCPKPYQRILKGPHIIFVHKYGTFDRKYCSTSIISATR